MALDLVPPGHRGNKFWLIYGRHNGKVVSYSTKTLDKQEARAVLRLYKKQPQAAARSTKKAAPRATTEAPWTATPLAQAARPTPATPPAAPEMTWEEVVRAYAANRHKRGKAIDLDWQVDGPEREEAKRIKQLFTTEIDGAPLGNKPARLVRPNDMDRLFNELARKAEQRTGNAWTNQTKNRQVLSYASAVIHYAAENEWMPPWRVSKLQQPETRLAHLTSTRPGS
jgi:hypothetical protein